MLRIDLCPRMHQCSKFGEVKSNNTHDTCIMLITLMQLIFKYAKVKTVEMQVEPDLWCGSNAKQTTWL